MGIDFTPKWKFYRNSLMLLLLTTSVPGILLGLSMHFLVSKNIQDELRLMHEDQLSNAAKTVDDQFNYLERTLSHWVYDPMFDETLKELDFTYGYARIHNLYDTLIVMEGTHPLIDHVELVLFEPQAILFNNARFFALNPEQREIYEEPLRHDRTMFWTELDESVALIHKISGRGGTYFGYLKVSLDPKKLLQLIENLSPYDNSVTFLARHDGDMMFIDSGNEPLGRALQQAVLSRGGGSSFLFEWNHETYSVSHGMQQRLSETWTYVSAAPISAITHPVQSLSELIFIISFIGLFLALLLSLFASRRLYVPIEKMANQYAYESQLLQNRLRRHLPHLREGFFLHLSQGYLYAMSEDELRQRSEDYGLALHERSIMAIVLQLERSEPLMSFAVSNILEDLAKAEFDQVVILRFHDLSVGVLLFFHDADEKAGTSIQQLCDDTVATIDKLLKMKVTLSKSRRTTKLSEVVQLFEEAKLALRFRVLDDVNQVIDADNVGNESQSVDYPLVLENKILHTLRTGDEQEAVQLISQFIRIVSENKAKEWFVQQAMLHLLGSFLHSILQMGVDPCHIYGTANLYEQMGQLRKPDEYLKWFTATLIRPFIEELKSRNDFRSKQLVEKTIAIIHENYAKDISLEYCADRLDTTFYALSKAFKQATGKNFIDYLTDLRLKKVKELLRDTNLKVNDIAEMVGYQPGYLHRIFKKHEGITPSRFRERLRRTM